MSVVLAPPLRGGDRLTRIEFERRYAAMSGKGKAELIDGVVYMASPVSPEHGFHHSLVTGFFMNYAAAPPRARAYSDTTLRLDERTVAQPDAMLLVAPESGGRVRRDPDGYFRGPVELVAEVSYSTASYDHHQKLEAYERSGCLEYLLVLVEAKEVRWFELREGAYERLAPDAAGVLRSRVFPGLWLDAPALLGGDAARLLETLRRGLAA